MKIRRTQVIRFILPFSKLLNFLLGGSIHQSFSARNHEWKERGKPNLTWIIDKILGEKHCLISYLLWRRKQSWKLKL